MGLSKIKEKRIIKMFKEVTDVMFVLRDELGTIKEISSKILKSRFVEKIQFRLNLDMLPEAPNLYIFYDTFFATFMKELFQSKYPNMIKATLDSDEESGFTCPENGVYTNKLDNKTKVIMIIEQQIKEVNGQTINDVYNKKGTVYIVGSNCHYWAVKLRRKSIYTMRNESKTKIKLIMGEGNERWISPKCIDKFIIKEDDKKYLIDSIDKFINNRKFYEDNGIPYNLGIIFYGTPGTGKTNLAYSIGMKYNLNVQVVTPDILYEAAITGVNIINNQAGIVFIDEIDSLFSGSNMMINGQIGGELRRDQILKFIDNIPNGKIIIGCTNFYDKLDEALLRPGRFDIKLEMENFSKADALKMVNLYGLDRTFLNKHYKTKDYPILPSGLERLIVEEKCSQLYRKENK